MRLTAADSVVLSYTVNPKPLGFEEEVCIAVVYTPLQGACVVDYRFLPRQSVFGPYRCL